MYDKKIEKLNNRYNEFVENKITLGEAINEWGNKYSEKIAICDSKKEYTYKQLIRDVNAYAAGLEKFGFKSGDKIILQLPNSYEFVAISFAMFKLGIIPIMALPAYRENEIQGILNKSEVAAYIIEDRYLGYDYRNLARSLFRYNDVNDIEIFVIGESLEFNSISRIYLPNYDNTHNPSITYLDTALFLLSGGTTGTPKLIPRRHGEFLQVARTIISRSGITSNSTYLLSVPIEHYLGICGPGLIGILSVGGKVVMSRTPSPDEIIPLIEKERVTVLGLVPTLITMCMEFLEYDSSYDLSSLKLIQAAGAVLEPQLARKIPEVFKCKLQQLYGMSEGFVCCTKITDCEDVVFNSQGRPLSDLDEVLIIRDNGELTEEEEYGELIVRSPYTISCYYNLKKSNKTCIDDKGYFHTGDKARKLINGNYEFAGRTVDVINRAGEKIIPSELEFALEEYGNITDVQVVGVKDDHLGERICICLLRNNEIDLSLEQIRKILLDRGFATFKLPDQLIYIDWWPLTGVGKISKEELENYIKKQNHIKEELVC